MRGSPLNRLEYLAPSTTTHPLSAGDRSSWSNRAQTWEVSLEQFIGDHPRLALAAAAAAGLILGWMVKRK